MSAINTQLLVTYAAPVARVVSLIANNAAAASERNEVSKGEKDTLADALRDLARITHEDDVPVEDTVQMFKLMGGAAELKAGTIKGYGASLAGFRKLLSDGEDIAAVNVKAAQEAVASEETKARKAASDRLRAAIKDKKVWTAARLNELAELAESMNPQSDQSAPTVAESEAVAEEARRAA